MSLRALYNLNQHLFLIMYPTTNKWSVHKTSTESTTLAQWWDVIIYAFSNLYQQTRSGHHTKKLIAEQHNISYFFHLPDTYPKFATAKEKYEAFSILLRVHLVKDNTISSSKPPKSHVKLITYMNNDNAFDLLIAVFFAMSPQLGRLGSKAQ